MAFNLNGFNVNHLVLDALSRPVLADADIVNRTNLDAQSMHFPNVHHFLLLLAMNERSPSKWVSENAFPKEELQHGFFVRFLDAVSE